MQKLIIRGTKRLEGSVNIHGAKNSILPIIAATVLLDGKSVLHNCPDLSEGHLYNFLPMHPHCDIDK